MAAKCGRESYNWDVMCKFFGADFYVLMFYVWIESSKETTISKTERLLRDSHTNKNAHIRTKAQQHDVPRQ